MDSLRSLFLLDSDVTFLNHGSFGACPRPVFEEYQHWQRELESRPVEFLGRRATALMAEARAVLAAYLGAPAGDVVYFPNPTTAVNMAAHSLRLQPGDEILTTDHEYGAMDRTWKVVYGNTGIVHGRMSQMAVRTQGVGVFICPARSAIVAGAVGGQLGVERCGGVCAQP